MVRDKEAADQALVEQLLSERWGGHLVLLRDDLNSSMVCACTRRPWRSSVAALAAAG